MSEVESTGTPSTTASTESSPSSAPVSSAAPASSSNSDIKGPTLESIFGNASSKSEGGETQPDAKVDPAAPVKPVYAPNFKFKIKDKEHEIPEKFRTLIQDEESEKMVREVFERSLGLDEVKAHREEIRTKYQTLETAHTQLNQSLQTLSDFVNQGDFGAFFSAIGISDEAILKYAYEKAEYMDLQPQQKAEYDRRVQAERAAYWAQQQAQEHQAKVQQYESQQRLASLQQAVSSPDVQNVVQSVDRSHGPGFFQQEAINEGINIWNMERRVATAQELVARVSRRYSPFVQQSMQAQAPQQQMAPQSQTPAQAQAPGKVPVIPVVHGSGASSPARKAVTSIEDIEREYQNYK